MLKNKLTLKSVSKSFLRKKSKRLVLSDISFGVRSGEILGIVGPSGCGKTTLLNIIAGLLIPDSGKYSIDIKNESILGHVGYMQQKDLLFPWLTVLENVLLGPDSKNINNDTLRSKSIELLSKFGLKDVLNEYPIVLSGGMRQRVAFLRTIIGSDELILLDEPFASLDALTRTNLQDWILQIHEILPRTIILVTHDVDEAIFLSDRVLVMSSSPSYIEEDVIIDFPRPRLRKEIKTKSFLEKKFFLLKKLGVIE